MGKYTFLVLFVTTLLSVSCIKEDTDGTHCLDRLNLVYEWSHGEKIQPTDSLIIQSSDGQLTYMRTDNSGTELQLIPGIYTLIAFEPTPSVKVTGMNLTIRTDPDGYAYDPAAFSSGFTVFVIGNNNTVQVYQLPMYRQTRELIVKVNCSGLGAESLSSVSGWLDGITVSRSLADGFPPIDGNQRHPAIIGGKVKYSFDITNPLTEPTRRFSGVHRLLGIDGPATQTLYLTLHYTGGQRELTANVTTALDNFHTVNVAEPFVLEINIDVNEDFTADVIDWQSGSLSEMEAH